MVKSAVWGFTANERWSWDSNPGLSGVLNHWVLNTWFRSVIATERTSGWWLWKPLTVSLLRQSGKVEHKREGGESKTSSFRFILWQRDLEGLHDTSRPSHTSLKAPRDSYPKGKEWAGPSPSLPRGGSSVFGWHVLSLALLHEQQRSLRKRNPYKQKTLPLWRRDKQNTPLFSSQIPNGCIKYSSATRYSVFSSKGWGTI